MTSRTVPVVAVFGSSRADTLDLAENLGHELAQRRCVLLTGGEGGTAQAVKDRALVGAARARREGWLAARIGVTRTEQPRSPARDDTLLLLGPGWGHRRNYVEAHLCDVAIAVPGGDGTDSEVAMCLGLGRPVVLVGPDWATRYPRHESELDAFVSRAARRLAPNGRPSPLDPPIEAALQALRERTVELPDVECLESLAAADAPAVADLALRLARPGVGTYPEIGQDAAARACSAWLGDIELRLAQQ